MGEGYRGDAGRIGAGDGKGRRHRERDRNGAASRRHAVHVLQFQALQLSNEDRIFWSEQLRARTRLNELVAPTVRCSGARKRSEPAHRPHAGESQMAVQGRNSRWSVVRTVRNDLHPNAGADRRKVPAGVASGTGGRRDAERDVLCTRSIQRRVAGEISRRQLACEQLDQADLCGGHEVFARDGDGCRQRLRAGREGDDRADKQRASQRHGAGHVRNRNLHAGDKTTQGAMGQRAPQGRCIRAGAEDRARAQ